MRRQPGIDRVFHALIYPPFRAWLSHSWEILTSNCQFAVYNLRQLMWMTVWLVTANR